MTLHLFFRKNVSYYIQRASNKKINVFFDDDSSIGVLRKMGDKSLSDNTPEEDFILGIMPGYDCIEQCERYFKRKK